MKMTRADTLLELKDISRIYQMGQVKVKALTNVSLEIAKGEFIVILGPSGSGKTTMLNLIGGMDSPTSGKITVDGIDTTTLDEKGLTRYRRDHIGFVFQFFNLIPSLTARENIEFAAELVKNPRDALDTLDVVGLKDRADHFPSELSGGEQQRVAIARAMVKDPPLLLCDEPTGDLDRQSALAIMELLQQLNNELHKTLIMVTHDPEAENYAGRRLRLQKGELVDG